MYALILGFLICRRRNHYWGGGTRTKGEVDIWPPHVFCKHSPVQPEPISARARASTKFTERGRVSLPDPSFWWGWLWGFIPITRGPAFWSKDQVPTLLYMGPSCLMIYKVLVESVGETSRSFGPSIYDGGLHYAEGKWFEFCVRRNRMFIDTEPMGADCKISSLHRLCGPSLHRNVHRKNEICKIKWDMSMD